MSGLKRQQKHLRPNDFEELMTWVIRLFIAIFLAVVYALALLGGLYCFLMTKDFRFLFFITPSALTPLVYYLVPMDKERYELKLAKISANKEVHEYKARVKMLEAELHRQQKQPIN